MKRIAIFMILAACPVMTLGQSSEPAPAGNPPYQPAVAQPNPVQPIYGGGGYGYDGGSHTLPGPGPALAGLSQVISAQGQYNLNTSAAAVNLTEAQSNALNNDVQHVQTFWEMRNIGRAQRAAERGPPPTAEELARRARAGAPSALSASQIDPVSGALYWPSALQDASYREQRTAVDECALRWVKYGSLNYNEQTQVRDNIDAMFDMLKSQIASIPPQDYVGCRRFLQSVLYATTRTTL